MFLTYGNMALVKRLNRVCSGCSSYNLGDISYSGCTRQLHLAGRQASVGTVVGAQDVAVRPTLRGDTINGIRIDVALRLLGACVRRIGVGAGCSFCGGASVMQPAGAMECVFENANSGMWVVMHR